MTASYFKIAMLLANDDVILSPKFDSNQLQTFIFQNFALTNPFWSRWWEKVHNIQESKQPFVNDHKHSAAVSLTV